MGKKKKNQSINQDIEVANTPTEENTQIDFTDDDINNKVTPENNDNKDINEDLYAPFGDKTFDPNNNNNNVGEDLYAPFGDKTFSKDALLDSNASNNNSIDEDLTIAIEDVKPKDQEIEKLRSDNEYLNNVDEDVIKANMKKKKTPEEQNVFDFDMIKNYMNKGYENFVKGKFNLMAALFGGLYLTYRKIYLGLLLFIIVVSLITFFIPNLIIVGIAVVCTIIIHIVIGMKFNKMYLNRSYKKIKEIEDKYNSNQDDFILNKSKELGGTNIVGTIAMTIIFGGIIIAGLLLIK